jgi:ankyrin repeat protein
MAAAPAARTANVVLLLDKGARIEAKDRDGNTALLLSASGSGLPSGDATKVLLSRGANIEARNKNGDTALILAASKGGYEDAKTVDLLLKSGANVSAKNNQGKTALALALKNRRTETVPPLRKAMASRRP